MSSSSALLSVQERGWRSGFANLLRKESGLWWGTRKWWIQSLVWFLVLNFILVPVLWIVPDADPTEVISTPEILDMFMNVFGAFATLGVMILIQSAIVEEKRSGTAAWILSNPVSRPAFILSKLIANAFSILVIVVMLQGLIVYVQVSLQAKEMLPALPFIAAMGLHSLHLLFYLTLGLMLGSIFNARGPVIGIMLCVLVGQELASGLLSERLPWLPLALPESVLRITPLVANEIPLPEQWYIPLLVTGGFCVVFTILAILRFQREEF